MAWYQLFGYRPFPIFPCPFIHIKVIPKGWLYSYTKQILCLRRWRFDLRVHRTLFDYTTWFIPVPGLSLGYDSV